MYHMIRWLLSHRQNPTYTDRIKLSRMCTRAASIAKKIKSNSASMAFMESFICSVVSHLDTTTRNNLFTTVNMIVESNQVATKQVLASAEMLDILTRDQNLISTTLIVKNIVEGLSGNMSKHNIKQDIKDEILKSVIVRLSMDMSYDNINQLILYLQSGKHTHKDTQADWHMYG